MRNFHRNNDWIENRESANKKKNNINNYRNFNKLLKL